MVSSPGLLAIGHPLLDIQVTDEDEKVLKKYDLRSNDAIFAEPHHMKIFDEISGMSPKYIAGGSAQNSIRCAQYVLPPDSTVYLGTVGNDRFSDRLREVNRKEGVREIYQVIDDQTTGACAVIINGNHRSLCTVLGAAQKFSLEHLKSQEVSKAIEHAKLYYVEGFFLTHDGIEVTLELARISLRDQKIFAMNLSSTFIVKSCKDQFDQVLPFVDYLFGNESEAREFAQVHDWEVTDLSTLATRIASIPKRLTSRPRIVIITRGDQPTIVASSSPSSFPIPSSSLQHDEYGHSLIISTLPLANGDQVVDTNGAGDAFAGGVLAGILLGKEIEQCVEIGHWLGEMCVKEIGAQLRWPKEKLI